MYAEAAVQIGTHEVAQMYIAGTSVPPFQTAKPRCTCLSHCDFRSHLLFSVDVISKGIPGLGRFLWARDCGVISKCALSHGYGLLKHTTVLGRIWHLDEIICLN